MVMIHGTGGSELKIYNRHYHGIPIRACHTFQKSKIKVGNMKSSVLMYNKEDP